MYTFEEIVAIVKQRQQNGSALLQRMLDVKERYNGEYVIHFGKYRRGGSTGSIGDAVHWLPCC